MNSRRLMEIERLRGIAVLMTVWTHAYFIHRWVNPAFVRASMGVDLFFVISGFVVTHSLLRDLPEHLPSGSTFLDRFGQARGSLRNFYLRRICRIFPLAIVWMILPFLACLALHPSTVFGEPGRFLREMYVALTFQYNYAFAFGMAGPLGPYWSLSVEEHFYILLPLLFVLFPTRNQRLLMCLGGIAIVVLYRPLDTWSGSPGAAWLYNYFATHRRFDGLLAGTALALLFSAFESPRIPETRSPLKTRLGTTALAGFAILLLWVCPGVLPEKLLSTSGFVVAWAIGVALVWAAGRDRGWVFGVPGVAPVLEYLGSRSFAIYLSHNSIFMLQTDLVTRYAKVLPEAVSAGLLGARIQLVSGVVATLVVSELSHRLIERPFIRLGKRLTTRDESAPHTGKQDHDGPPADEPNSGPLATGSAATAA